jgi:type I restriction enzyme M protein
LSSTRNEIAFLCKIINLLGIGGKACIILPDGVLENPSFSKLRENILKRCDITAIISLPKFAFAPYTKEKTYAVFLTKRSDKETKKQTDSIWLYIIDNDGLANSDKRFPTKLRNNRNGWAHDEISGWVSTEGEEMPGLLEKRWLKYNDEEGTSWIDENGKEIKLRKACFLEVSKLTDKNYYNLLPESYLRKYEPKYITKEELDSEVKKLKEIIATHLK